MLSRTSIDLSWLFLLTLGLVSQADAQSTSALSGTHQRTYQLSDSSLQSVVRPVSQPLYQETKTTSSPINNYLEEPQAEFDQWAQLESGGGAEAGGAEDGEGGGNDASDPTNVAFHLMFEWEWQELRNNDGNLLAFKVSPFIPIEIGDVKTLLNVEIPLPQHSGLPGIGHDTGIGDTRLKYFVLLPTERDFVSAVVPSFDAIAPTGDASLGLGGGQWILMPNIVFAVNPAKNWQMYPFFRYVHAEPVASAFVPGLPIPNPDPDVFNATRQSAMNIEWINVFQLQDAFFDWLEVTPDYYKNYAADQAETFTMKYTAAKQVKEGLFVMTDFWHPVSGMSQTTDFTFKIRLDWYPQTNKCRKCRGRCGCRRR